MATQQQNVSTIPIDIVSARSLSARQTVRMENIGPSRGRLTLGGVSPDADAPYVGLDFSESIQFTLSGEPVWAWTGSGQTRFSVTLLAVEQGPLRDRVAVDVSSSDFVRDGGFILQVNASGSITYRTLDGDTDITEMFSAAGTVNVGGVPVLLRAVRQASSAPAMIAGVL